METGWLLSRGNIVNLVLQNKSVGVRMPISLAYLVINTNPNGNYVKCVLTVI